jgi:hypothetical protein
MTTGHIHIPGGYPGTNFTLDKAWNGQDGKYVLGTTKDKWNDYSMDLVQESDQFGQTMFPVSCTSSPVQDWSPADDMRLQSKLVKKVKGHEFNLAVNLAQAHQVVDMCASTIRKLGRSILHLKHGNITQAVRELGVGGNPRPLKAKDVSGRWLEMQYGWLPLVSDAYEAAKAFEAISQGRSARIVAKIRYQVPYNGSAIPSQYTCAGWTTNLKKIVYLMEEELSFGRSLGLTDPLSVVWEIIPYSFVVDWFLPVGTYLENLNVIPKLKGKFLTTLYQRTECAFTSATSPVWRGARRQSLQIKVRRVVSTGLTTQLPTFVNPIDALSPKRIANAISLCHQAFNSSTLRQGLRFLDVPF